MICPLPTLAVAGGLIASHAADLRAGSQPVVLTDSGSSTAPSDSTVGSAHDYTHRTNTFSTGADWTITWSSSGLFAVSVDYLVVGQAGSGGPGSGTVHMYGSGQHHLSIVSEKAYSVVVRSALSK